MTRDAFLFLVATQLQYKNEYYITESECQVILQLECN
jgi:hypothetical protein